jgi:methyl-accepting chemotaxis protein
MPKDTYKDPRELFIGFSCITGIIITSVIGLPSVFRGELVGKIIFLYGCVLLANLIFVQVTKNIQLSAFLLLITGLPYFLYLFVMGGVENTGFLWSFVVPPCAVFLVGLRQGATIVILYLLTLVIFLVQGAINKESLLLDNAYLLRFILVYLFISCGSILNEFTREKSFHKFRSANKQKKESEEELSELYNQLEKSKNLQTQLSEKIGIEAQEISNKLIVASSQVAKASKHLAVGATKQASSLEEIAGSVEEIGVFTKTNAQNSKTANDLSGRAIKAAKNGVSQMDVMVASMDEINEASNEILQIIKTIDDIAFQTNLLAINAAVEAARAGKHGKGFAVVAQEVRILSSRCTKAASRTSDLIESSVSKIESGNIIAEKTSRVLDDINTKINDMGILVSKITKASQKQVQGIELVNNGLSDIEKVTVENASTAEEASKSAEELSYYTKRTQSLIESTIDIFYNLQDSMEEDVRNSTLDSSQIESPINNSEKIRPDNIISLDDKEFGRY